MSREAMKLALEALEKHAELGLFAGATITILKQALEQPEPEPLAWANRVIGGRKWLSIHASKGASDKWLEYRIKEQAQGEKYEQVALYTSQPKREPEPVAWTLLLAGENAGIIGKAGETFESHPKYYKRVDVYTSPPKRKPLTDEQMEQIHQQYGGNIKKIMRAVEAANGIKGEEHGTR